MASAFFRSIPWLFAPSRKVSRCLAISAGILLPHGPPEQVGAAEGIARQGPGDLHDLFLVDDDPVGVLQDRLQLRQVIGDRLPAVLAVDEVVHHPRAERAGAIEGAGGDDVLEAGGLQLDQHLLHAAGFELEDAGGIAGLEIRS